MSRMRKALLTIVFGAVFLLSSCVAEVPQPLLPNQPPTAVITAPTDGSSFIQGDTITFAGSGSDPEDGPLTGASLVWTSSIDGQIGTGESFIKSDLSIGTHTITLTATDSQGATGTDSITITVTAPPPNQPPTCNDINVTTDEDNSVDIDLASYCNDPDGDPLTGSFVSDPSHGTAQFLSPTIRYTPDLNYNGSDTFQFRVTDGQDESDTATVNVQIVAVNDNPTATITSPADGSSFTQGDTITFTGSATDPEDGALTGASLVWTSSIDGQIGTGESFTRNDLSVGTHTITLTATDLQGATGTDSVTITVTTPPNQPPVAVIKASPTSGSAPITVDFDISESSDPDGNIVSFTLDFGDSNTVSGTDIAQPISHIYYCTGIFTATLTVTDDGGATDVASVDVTLTSGPPGTVKWCFKIEEDYINTAPAIGPDGTIYVVSHYDNLYAINPDGTEKWRFYMGGEMSASPAIGPDGTIYVIPRRGILYAINPDGTEKWRFDAGRLTDHELAIGSDGTIYIPTQKFAPEKSGIYAINPDGTEKWYFELGAVQGLAIGTDGTVYAHTGDSLYAINPNGTEKWHFPKSAGVRAPAIGADGTIYVDGNGLYAINQDGTEKWHFVTELGISSPPAIGADGTVYFPSHDDNLYAINPDGTEKWRFTVPNDMSTTPAIGTDGTIYAGSYHPDNKLYAINPDGTEKWHCLLISTIFWATGPAIGTDGTIYIEAGPVLYAINGESGGLANTPWPMFHHDVRHTGRAGGP